MLGINTALRMRGNVGKALAMVDETWDELKSYAKKYKCCDAQDENKNKQFKDAVRKFLEAPGGREIESIENRPDLIGQQETFAWTSLRM